MKTLTSVLFVLAATTATAFGDSAYFLPTSPSALPTVTFSSAAAVAVRTDRVSVAYRPMPRPTATAGKPPMVFVDRRYTRGSAQAVIVR